MNNTEIKLDNQLCFGVYRATKAFNHFYAETLKQFDLTYVQYITLLALWEKDNVTVKELGQSLSLDSGTLTPLLKRMEQKGWLTRHRSDIDERQVEISLTKKAWNAKEDIMSSMRSCIEDLGYEQEEYDELLHAMNDLIGRMQD